MAVKSAPAKAGSKAPAKDVMEFTFSDTIAGYVKRYDRNADSFTIDDERRPRVRGQADRDDLRPAGAQPRRAVRRLHRPDARHARARALPVRLRRLLPGGRHARLRGARHSPSPARAAHDYVFEKPDWWVKQIRQIADFYYARPVPRRACRLARVPGRHRHDRQQDRRPPGDRHHLAAGLRPVARRT